MWPQTLLLVLLGFALVLLNGFFVAAEFAIVKLRRTQADELGRVHGVRGRVLRTVRTNLDVYLSACQLGITLASLGLGWIGEPAFARLLEPLLAYLGVTDSQAVQSISFAVAFAFISFLHIVLGELAPKSIAIRRAETVALNTALPLYLFYWLMYPFIAILNGASNVIVRRLGVEMASEGDTVHSVDELRSVLRASHRHGELGVDEARILAHGLDLGELTVGDLMRPLSELEWITSGSPIEQVLAEVRATRFTRYPVRDQVTGRFTSLLHIKDLITADERLREIRNLQPYLRRLPYFNDDAPLLQVLKAFRTGDPHFAIITDALGTEIGFVTFEHVVEALLGPVEDEFAKKTPAWLRAGDGSVSGPASLSLLSLEEAIGRAVPEVDANSVGGLVLERLGRLPRQGERVRFPEFEVEIVEMHGPRIEHVLVRPADAPR
jgi:CBS domain containing-hemolysin-like protein